MYFTVLVRSTLATEHIHNVPPWISKNPGPIEPLLPYYRGILYVSMDNGVLVRLDRKPGVEQYRERLGGNCSLTPFAGGRRIYLSNKESESFVVQAGTNFELLATNDLGERITASPAVTGDCIIFRTDSNLFCIGKGR